MKSTIDNNVCDLGFDTTRQVQLMVVWPLPDDLSLASIYLYAMLMKESPASFASFRTLALKYDSIGGFPPDFQVVTIGGKRCLLLTTGCVINRFMHSFPSVESLLISRTEKLISRGPKLDPVSLSLAKGKLCQSIRSFETNPQAILVRAVLSCYNNLKITSPTSLKWSAIEGLKDTDVSRVAEAVASAKSFAVYSNIRHGGSIRKHFGSTGYVLQPFTPAVCNTGSADPQFFFTPTRYDLVNRIYRLSGPVEAKPSFATELIQRLVQSLLWGLDDSVLFLNIREKEGLVYSMNVSFYAPDLLSISFRTGLGLGRSAIRRLDEAIAGSAEAITASNFDSAINNVRDSIHENFAEADARIAIDSMMLGWPISEGEQLQDLAHIQVAQVKDLLNRLVPEVGIVVTQPGQKEE